MLKRCRAHNFIIDARQQHIAVENYEMSIGDKRGPNRIGDAFV